MKDAQVYNFDKWDVLGKNVSVGLLHYDSWEEEVNHVISFYQNKKEVLGEYIQSM